MSSSLRQAVHRYADHRNLVESYFDRGWTDGLPIVPPTPELAGDFFSFLGEQPDEIVGTIPSQDVAVTAEQVAVNAVMAGCGPECGPLVMAAVRAFLDPLSNAHGTTGSLASPAHMVLVNGPARMDLGVNCGAGCFGPGARANATIGRALRLVIRNCCNALPGFADRAAFSQPARYSFCFGEDEEASGWVPLHVERGFAPDSNVVTVSSFTEMYALRDTSGDSAEQLLRRFASMARSRPVHVDHALGDERTVLIVIGPEHRDRLIAEGWSKADVRTFLFPLLTAPPSNAVDGRNAWGLASEGGEAESSFGLPAAQGLLIATAGGPGLGLSYVFYPHWSAAVSKEF